MGNYWEAAEPAFAGSAGNIADGFREPVASLMSDTPQHMRVSDSGQPVYPVTGAAGQGGDRSPYGDPPGGGWSGGPPNTGDRDYQYDGEERYWTDYLRIAAPILGVILMVLVFWLAISSFLDDDPADEVASGSDTTPVTIPTVLNTPETALTPTPSQGTPPIIVGNATPGTETGVANGTPTTPSEGEPTTGGEITVGATVEVVNTGGAGVNVRALPSTDSEIIAVFNDGTILTVTGDPVEAEGFVWWPVESEDGIAGWVVEEYLAPVE